MLTMAADALNPTIVSIKKNYNM